jgi:hypothetical protein
MMAIADTEHETDRSPRHPGLARGGVLAAVVDEVLDMVVWPLRTPRVTGRLEADRIPTGGR